MVSIEIGDFLRINLGIGSIGDLKKWNFLS